MAADPKLAATFAERWTELGLAETAPVGALDATIAPPPPQAGETARLPRISLSFATEADTAADPGDRAELRADLVVMGVLGEGGMGCVHAARQRSLGRDIAIKTLKRGVSAAGAMAALLREAVITGTLEHPNVVPVHALGVDERGLPVLVMKRVEGVEWRQLLHDPRHPAWASRPGARLVVHLEILMQVCQAAHFAHSRGVVHRDIKPENVMLGEFGEVYLMDWGIAAREHDTARTEGSAGLVGTPAYMAPEMVAGRPVDPRTDVYMLGAALHEVLTGSFRNAGDTLQEVLMAAFCAEPARYSDAVPAELAELANRATARDPAARPQSALELRHEIAAYLRHRGSVALADEAAERLAQLSALLRASDAEPASIDLDAAYRLAHEARFGFVQALRDWPDNPGARGGFSETLEATAELELVQGHVETAETLLREVARPSDRVLRALERARRRRERLVAEQERLRALVHDLDTRVAGTQRTKTLAAVAGASLAISAFALSQPNPARLRPEALLVFAVVVVLAMAGTVVAFRRSLFQNAFNRRLVGLGFVGGGALLVSRAIGTWLGMPAPLIFMQDLLLLSAVAAAGSVSLPWMWLLVPVLLGSTAMCVYWPGYSPLAFALAGTLTPPLVAFALWRHHQADEQRLGDGVPESTQAP